VAADVDGALGAGELDHGFEALVDAFDAHAVGVDVGLVGRALVAFGNEFDGAGVIHAEGPLNDVEMMRAPIAVLAAAVFGEAAPAAAVVAAHAIGVIRAPGGGAEPAVVVEFGGERLFAEIGDGGKRAEASLDARDLADEAV